MQFLQGDCALFSTSLERYSSPFVDSENPAILTEIPVNEVALREIFCAA